MLKAITVAIALAFTAIPNSVSVSAPTQSHAQVLKEATPLTQLLDMVGKMCTKVIAQTGKPCSLDAVYGNTNPTQHVAIVLLHVDDKPVALLFMWQNGSWAFVQDKFVKIPTI